MSKVNTFFRYPGGKNKLKKQIVATIQKHLHKDTEYREPFFGGGSIGLSLLFSDSFTNDIWINDKDKGVADLWTSVMQTPSELKKEVMNFTPSVSNFEKYKQDLCNESLNEDTLTNGFKKLAVHQTSYSGLGTKSGGPLGGKKQQSKYKIDCRWSPKYICEKINTLHQKFQEITIRDNRCTNKDFAELIEDSSDAFIYLDPPYYDKGGELYQHAFTTKDHERLATKLKNSTNPWLLSYDECDEIKELYSWAHYTILPVNYSINSSRTKNELLIYPERGFYE